MTDRPNPFVGPRAFEPGEKLYGRDRELRSLSSLLVAERIVLMHSPSGAGKTSLLKAGLLPMLREDEFNVLPVARVNIEPPAGADGANRYVLSTLLSLEEGRPEAERLPIDKLSGLSLDAYLGSQTADKDNVLVLDQFEEILTLSSTDRDGKLEFFNQLGEALRAKNRWALISMREDYLGTLAPYVRPIPDRLVTRFRLDLLTADAAIQAMQMPAKAAGVDFSIAAAQKLADDLRRVQVQQPDGSTQSELGDYVEPVQLQVVCYRLWESLKPEDSAISEEMLSGVGDVDESLAEYYAQTVGKVAAAVPTPERGIREWFDRKLLTPEGLRGQVRMGVDQSEGLPNAAVRQLENAHIIRADQRAGQTWIELAHDRLINPVRNNNHKWFQDNLSLFQRQAEIWQEKDRSEGLLLRGRELDQAEKQIVGMQLRPEEQDFLDACRLLRRRANRERVLRRGIAIGGVASLLLGLVAAYFWYSAAKANRSFIEAANTAQAASTQAIIQQSYAQVASTAAIQQQSLAQAASTQAIAQQATAQAASTQAIHNANAAATAEAQSEAEKLRADEQRKQAEASALVAQSLLMQLKLKDDLANLLAVEAYGIGDTPRTRTQLVAPIYTKGQMPLAQDNTSGLVTALFYLPDGSGMVSADYFDCKTDSIFTCNSGQVRFWIIDRESRTPLKLPNSLRQNPASLNVPGIVDTVALSPDGATLAVASCNPDFTNTLKCLSESLSFWNIKTRASAGKTLTVNSPSDNIKAVQMAYSPDGKTLALVLNEQSVFNTGGTGKPLLTLWNTADWSQIGQLTPDQGLYDFAFSPDGKTLAMAGGSTVTLLDVASQQSSPLSAANGPSRVLCLAYSPDGKLLAIGTSDGNLRFIDLARNLALDPVMNNIGKPVTITFSPDGKILAAGYQDAGLLLWDVSSRQRLISSPSYKHIEVPDTFPANYPIFSLAFSPDGKQLASAGDEIILWDMDPQSWSFKACNIAGRNFTKSEWLQYFPDLPYHVTCPQFPPGK